MVTRNEVLGHATRQALKSPEMLTVAEGNLEYIAEEKENEHSL